MDTGTSDMLPTTHPVSFFSSGCGVALSRLSGLLSGWAQGSPADPKPMKKHCFFKEKQGFREVEKEKKENKQEENEKEKRNRKGKE